MTRMPAEVCDRLRVYLENARLTSVAVFFKESVAKLDEKVVLSFSNAIYRLTELFAVELKSCNWSVVSQGAHLDDQIRQLDEQLEWLCSVANDSLRLKEIDIRLVPGYHERLDSSPSTQYSLQRIINACNFNIDLAADHIACIIFRELSLSSKDGFWTEDHIHLKWLPLSSSGDSKHKKQHPSTSVNDINCDYDDLLTQFCTQLNDLREFVSIRVVDYLEPFCFYRLICICAIKVSVRYMCMLRVAVASDRRFSMEGLEARQIKRHCEAIVECFTMIMSECAMPLSEYGDFHTQFLTLSTIPALVSDDTSSPEFNDALQSLLKFAELQNGSRREAAALCRFIETCLKLRRDVKADEIPIPKFAVATSPAKVIHTAAASKYPSLTAFFDTIDYIFPSSADDHGTETLDNEISFHLRLSRLFYSTVPSRDEADRSLFISVFLLQSNLISKQPAAKLTSTMSNLFKDSKASTPTQQDSGHSISNLIPASKTVKAISKTIRVTGLCALNLETSFTRPKAFFKLCVGNSTQTTSIASHSAYPSWVDEEYIFVVDDLERASLMLKLYFEGAMYGHYEVGFVHVSLSTLDISSIDDVTYAINPSKGTSNGMNHFHSGSCKVSVQLSK